MTADLILKAVEEETGVTRAEIMGTRRTLHINQARRAAMYLCRHLCGMSYGAIGDIFSRHHTTILFSIRPGKRHNHWLSVTVPAIQATLQKAQGAVVYRTCDAASVQAQTQVHLRG